MLNETKNGYKSREEAINDNDAFEKEFGKNIPEFDMDKILDEAIIKKKVNSLKPEFSLKIVNLKVDFNKRQEEVKSLTNKIKDDK